MPPVAPTVFVVDDDALVRAAVQGMLKSVRLRSETFATPQAQVKRATLGALSRMQIKVVEAKRNGSTETIRAKASDRDIEIELEALTPSTTRMAVTAKKDGGILRDGATATEIILQTEKLVGPT